MPDKRIALCIASRGNPRSLFETLRSILPRCALPATTAVIGLDADDPDLPSAQAVIEALGSERIVVSVAPRADAIGAVYNRCAAAVEADLYINGADDFRILTSGWDAILAHEAGVFRDNIGMIGFGQPPVPSVLPSVEATTRGLIQKMGYFLQDYTPYWWMDTWLYEIATMIGRNHYVPIEVELMELNRTRGLREVNYWARFFDEMRVHRRAIAERIISSPDFLASAERRQELHGALDHLCKIFERSLAFLRDPAYGQQLEITAHEAADDERYRRVKERSLKVLEELEESRVRVA